MTFFGNRSPQEDIEVQQEDATPAAPPKANNIGFDTVLGTNSAMEGKFACIGNVRLNGHFSGTLEIDGNILVGESAVVHADIAARNISIAGSVHGHVTGKKVQILRTGVVWGDIQASALTTEEGAFIEGKITMQSQAKQAEVEEGDAGPPRSPQETITAPEIEVPDVTATVETGRIPTFDELDELDDDWQETPPDGE